MKVFSNYHIQSKDKLIADSSRIFEMQLNGFEGFDGLVDGVQDRFLVRQHSNPLNEYKEDRELVCRLSTSVKKGSIINLTKENETWLVISDVDTDKLLQYCKIQKCTGNLSFYKTQILRTIPCIITAVGNSLGMSNDANKYVTDISDVIMVKVPDNETSRLIEINDIFKIGKRNYKVTNDSDIIESGLLIFKMQITLEEPEVHVFTLDITNGETISVQEGSTLQINTSVYDNGVLASPTPTLSYSSNNILVCSVSSTGLVTGVASGSAIITVALASNNTVKDTINVEVTALPQNNYTYTLSSTSLPDTEIKINSIKTYTAIKLNSGVQVSQTFTFSVVGDVTAYQLTIVDGNNCSIKALKSSGSITLKAVDNSDSSKFVEKNIVLKNLF